jgi:hypothetical protein
MRGPLVPNAKASSSGALSKYELFGWSKRSPSPDPRVRARGRASIRCASCGASDPQPFSWISSRAADRVSARSHISGRIEFLSFVVRGSRFESEPPDLRTQHS